MRRGTARSNSTRNQQGKHTETTCFGTSSPSKGSHRALFTSLFVLCYWEPGTEGCLTSKIPSILHGVRFNLATEKSNGDGALERRAMKVVRDVFTRTGFSSRPPRLRCPSGACQATLQGKAGNVPLKSVRWLPAPLWAPLSHDCMATAAMSAPVLYEPAAFK